MSSERLVKVLLPIFLVCFYQAIQVSSLHCYSCSTLAGDVNCTEDNFDPNMVNIVECPPESDICVRIIQINSNSYLGAVARSCAKSMQEITTDVCDYGFYPKGGNCLVYVTNSNSGFANTSVEICSCDSDLSNDKTVKDCPIPSTNN